MLVQGLGFVRDYCRASDRTSFVPGDLVVSRPIVPVRT